MTSCSSPARSSNPSRTAVNPRHGIITRHQMYTPEFEVPAPFLGESWMFILCSTTLLESQLVTVVPGDEEGIPLLQNHPASLQPPSSPRVSIKSNSICPLMNESNREGELGSAGVFRGCWIAGELYEVGLVRVWRRFFSDAKLRLILASAMITRISP